MQTAIVPSIIAPGRVRDMGALDMGLRRRGRRSRQDVPLTVEFDGQAYLAGDGVWMHHSRPTERLNFSSLGNGVFGRVMTYAALGTALQPGTHRGARVLYGLPVQVLESAAQAKRIMAELRRWMVGVHRFSVDGQPFEVEIAEVRGMAQPLGAFFAWAYQSGDRHALRRTIAIADPGFNTLDLYTVSNLAVSPLGTTGDTIGVHQAAKEVVHEVRRLTGVTISLRQADSLLRRGEAVIQGHDITPVIQAALQSNATAIAQAVNIAWDNLLADVRIAAGGGAALYQDYISRSLPGILVLPDPATANARGLAQYARRQLWEDADLVIGLDPGFGAYKVAVEQ